MGRFLEMGFGDLGSGREQAGESVEVCREPPGNAHELPLDGRCEISNNAAERRAKSYAVGRKASMFHASEAGAEASAIIYSMVETAKANKLNVFQYLYTVLLYMPDYKNELAGIEQLLPWSEFIKEHCAGLIDVETVTAEKHAHLPC